MAISGRQLRFRRWLSHDSVGSCEIATAPLGPRNDKIGSITRSTRVHTNLQLPMALTARKGDAATPHTLAFAVFTADCTGRKCAAGSGMPLPYRGAHHLTTAGTERQCLPEIPTSLRSSE